jgi:signal transduction histidine kinase
MSAMEKPQQAFRTMVASGAVFYLIMLALTLGVAAPKLGIVRVSGWSSACDNGGCRVSKVVAGGPAAGILQPGDSVLAVNDVRGFSRRLVPGLTTVQFGPGTTYSMQIRRGAEARTVQLTIGSKADESMLPRTGSLLIISFVYFAAAIFTGWYRHDFLTARWCSLACGLTAFLFLGLALQMFEVYGWGILPLSQLLRLASPWFLVATYVFLENFPQPVPDAAGWRRIRMAIVAAAGAQWVLFSVSALPNIWPPASRRAVAAWIPPELTGIANNVYLIVLAGVIVASTLVLIRNYRLHRQPDERRRARLLAAAIMVSFLVTAGVTVLQYFNACRCSSLVDWTNLVTICVPVAIIHGIRKHRLMGIRMAILQTLHVLLAKHLLQAAIAAPLIWPLVRVLFNPEMPAGELFRPGAGTILMVAGAGLALAFRTSILQKIDRRFMKERYEGQNLIEAVANEIREQDTLQDAVWLVKRHVMATFGAEEPVFYGRVERDSGFVSSGRESVPASSPLAKFLDRQKTALAVPLGELPQEDSLEDLSDRMLIIMPGSPNHAAGFLLLGEKLTQEPYTSSDLAVLRGLAMHVGSQYENRLLADERITAIDAERKRMARELHDTLSQGFAGIFLHLESARDLIDEEPDQSRLHVEQASDLARYSLTQARNSVRNLRSDTAPFILEEELKRLKQRLNVSPDIAIEVHSECATPVPQEASHHLLRVAEESVTNSLRHSGATHIGVELSSDSRGVRLTVVDNGRGFNPGRSRKGGYGLLGMKERMAQLRGTLDIVSSEDSGTEVRAAVAIGL